MHRRSLVLVALLLAACTSPPSAVVEEEVPPRDAYVDEAELGSDLTPIEDAEDPPGPEEDMQAEVELDAEPVACQRVPTPGEVSAAHIEAGMYHSCLVLSTGCVVCRGRNASGQLGVELDAEVSLEWQPVAGVEGIVGLAAGGLHSCALHDTGEVSCWGSHDQGQLGHGEPGEGRVLPPALVAGLDEVDALVAGYAHTCALRRGEVWCWGSNEKGQIGVGEAGGVFAEPQRVEGLEDVVELGAGRFQTCALAAGGAVWCWGHFRCGAPVEEEATRPLRIEGLESATSVGAGFCVSAAVDAEGGAHRWGRYGLKPIEGLPPLQAIDHGHKTGCALTVEGAVWCYWQNAFGEMGQGHRDRVEGPAEVALRAPVAQISMAGGHTCARLEDDSVWCWGPAEPRLGDFSDEHIMYHSRPRQVW